MPSEKWLKIKPWTDEINDLKECPFCGKQPTIHIVREEGIASHGYLECCFIRTKHLWITQWERGTNKDLQDGPFLNWTWTDWKSELRELWNKRIEK